MRLFAAILIAVASTSAVARADDPPVEPTAEPVPAAPAPGSRAGITLPAGGLQIMLALEMSFSKDVVFKPFSVAPDVT